MRCLHYADSSKSKSKKEGGSSKTAAEELSEGQERAAKAELKRMKAAEAERKAKGSYLQVGSRGLGHLSCAPSQMLKSWLRRLHPRVRRIAKC